jgi:hypothetical protein
VTTRSRTAAYATVLYASYALTIVLSFALFMTVVFFVAPPLLGARLPSMRALAACVAIPLIMMAVALGSHYPAAYRAVRGLPPSETADAFSGAGQTNAGCLVIVFGFSLASLVATLPLVVIRFVLAVN